MQARLLRAARLAPVRVCVCACVCLCLCVSVCLSVSVSACLCVCVLGVWLSVLLYPLPVLQVLFARVRPCRGGFFGNGSVVLVV